MLYYWVLSSRYSKAPVRSYDKVRHPCHFQRPTAKQTYRSYVPWFRQEMAQDVAQSRRHSGRSVASASSSFGDNVPVDNCFGKKLGCRKVILVWPTASVKALSNHDTWRHLLREAPNTTLRFMRRRTSLKSSRFCSNFSQERGCVLKFREEKTNR